MILVKPLQALLTAAAECLPDTPVPVYECAQDAHAHAFETCVMRHLDIAAAGPATSQRLALFGSLYPAIGTPFEAPPRGEHGCQGRWTWIKTLCQFAACWQVVHGTNPRSPYIAQLMTATPMEDMELSELVDGLCIVGTMLTHLFRNAHEGSTNDQSRSYVLEWLLNYVLWNAHDAERAINRRLVTAGAIDSSKDTAGASQGRELDVGTRFSGFAYRLRCVLSPALYRFRSVLDHLFEPHCDPDCLPREVCSDYSSCFVPVLVPEPRETLLCEAAFARALLHVLCGVHNLILKRPARPVYAAGVHKVIRSLMDQSGRFMEYVKAPRIAACSGVDLMNNLTNLLEWTRSNRPPEGSALEVNRTNEPVVKTLVGDLVDMSDDANVDPYHALVASARHYVEGIGFHAAVPEARCLALLHQSITPSGKSHCFPSQHVRPSEHFATCVPYFQKWSALDLGMSQMGSFGQACADDEKRYSTLSHTWGRVTSGQYSSHAAMRLWHAHCQLGTRAAVALYAKSHSLLDAHHVVMHLDYAMMACFGFRAQCVAYRSHRIDGKACIQHVGEATPRVACEEYRRALMGYVNHYASNDSKWHGNMTAVVDRCAAHHWSVLDLARIAAWDSVPTITASSRTPMFRRSGCPPEGSVTLRMLPTGWCEADFLDACRRALRQRLVLLTELAVRELDADEPTNLYPFVVTYAAVSMFLNNSKTTPHYGDPLLPALNDAREMLRRAIAHEAVRRKLEESDVCVNNAMFMEQASGVLFSRGVYPMRTSPLSSVDSINSMETVYISTHAACMFELFTAMARITWVQAERTVLPTIVSSTVFPLVVAYESAVEGGSVEYTAPSAEVCQIALGAVPACMSTTRPEDCESSYCQFEQRTSDEVVLCALSRALASHVSASTYYEFPYIGVHLGPQRCLHPVEHAGGVTAWTLDRTLIDHTTEWQRLAPRLYDEYSWKVPHVAAHGQKASKCSVPPELCELNPDEQFSNVVQTAWEENHSLTSRGAERQLVYSSTDDDMTLNTLIYKRSEGYQSIHNLLLTIWRGRLERSAPMKYTLFNELLLKYVDAIRLSARRVVEGCAHEFLLDDSSSDESGGEWDAEHTEPEDPSVDTPDTPSPPTRMEQDQRAAILQLIHKSMLVLAVPNCIMKQLCKTIPTEQQQIRFMQRHCFVEQHCGLPPVHHREHLRRTGALVRGLYLRDARGAVIAADEMLEHCVVPDTSYNRSRLACVRGVIGASAPMPTAMIHLMTSS